MSGGAGLMILSLTTGACLTEHSLHIPFHNELCKDRKVLDVAGSNSNDTVTVTVKEEYAEAKGETKYIFTKDGKLAVDYSFTSKINVNPRQWGMVFSVPSQIDHLKWYRQGLWSRYPEDHIGRVNGEAVPFGDKAFFPDSLRHKPENAWRYDANKLGTNDFRSTRENIYWASLTNNNGQGIVVLSDGKQAFRAFVNDNKGISFLVAGYSTGGGDLFFSGHYRDERKKLVEGSKLEGSIEIQLVDKTSGSK
jgi:hypothetical protein